MARTKQTARKSTGGKAPRKLMQCSSASAFRQFMTQRQQTTYGTGSSSAVGPQANQSEKTSYLNYENMFYSYNFSTGPQSTKRFEPRFTFGAGVNPTTCQKEEWIGMSLNSMYDGDGMKVHGRPHISLVIVLDVSGSMGFSFDDDNSLTSKMEVAKECLQSLCDQLNPTDSFGLVIFNHTATNAFELKPWKSVKKNELKRYISKICAGGATNLTEAITAATKMFMNPAKVSEKSNSTSRVIFLTDLQSTCDSTNDEKTLLKTIRQNGDRGIYTTVVGIGMDLNVRLVEEISTTKGAKYCSVDSTAEFKTLINKEFDYDVTILAFNIRITLVSDSHKFVKGYGSPELNEIKNGKTFTMSSEFPTWQNEKGESKGGMLLLKLGPKGGKGKGKKGSKPAKAASTVKIEVRYDELSGLEKTETHTVHTQDTFSDTGTRKAALLVHYVDLHNDYVLQKGKHGTKYLELFQTFRDHFTKEMEDMKDKTLATSNKGDLEMIDKIIELEKNPKKKESYDGGSAWGKNWTSQPFGGTGTSTVPFGTSAVPFGTSAAPFGTSAAPFGRSGGPRAKPVVATYGRSAIPRAKPVQRLTIQLPTPTTSPTSVPLRRSSRKRFGQSNASVTPPPKRISMAKKSRPAPKVVSIKTTPKGAARPAAKISKASSRKSRKKTALSKSKRSSVRKVTRQK